MTLIRITLSSNAQEVGARLGAFPPAMLQAIARAMDLENELTVGHAQATKLTGPRPEFLGVRTNRLRSSLRPEVATVEGQSVRSAIGTNVEYAGVHEFGFDGDVQVRAHTRRIIRTSAGATASLDARGRIVRRKKTAKTQTGTAPVKAHTRRMRMPERSFIRSSIGERTGDYTDSISAAIVSAWEGSAS